ncbi:hypothetical protein [Amycolatopsis plumensis]|uniref:hypothetical protein n=1 Tax=Amycolatopsis plumensis TaxID=236508 RepID=UPI003613DA8B
MTGQLAAADHGLDPHHSQRAARLTPPLAPTRGPRRSLSWPRRAETKRVASGPGGRRSAAESPLRLSAAGAAAGPARGAVVGSAAVARFVRRSSRPTATPRSVRGRPRTGAPG